MEFTELLSQKNILIVVTGISCSGKTTLANKIKGFVKDAILISGDDYKVELYNQYGFNDKHEKAVLRELALAKFRAEIMLYARTGLPLIIDYQFDLTWSRFLHFIRDRYSYTTIVIQCQSLSFDELWERRLKRDFNSLLRDRCLTASKYFLETGEYERDESKYDEISRIAHRESYESGKYTELKGHYTFQDNEINIK